MPDPTLQEQPKILLKNLAGKSCITHHILPIFSCINRFSSFQEFTERNRASRKTLYRDPSHSHHLAKPLPVTAIETLISSPTNLPVLPESSFTVAGYSRGPVQEQPQSTFNISPPLFDRNQVWAVENETLHGIPDLRTEDLWGRERKEETFGPTVLV
ncbi:hypothetical protein ACTXT7_008659 [Hymenolepis weldensis]